MLTALEVENFKGIAGRQRIDFAPLTLLFGANSAGKSTILQALLYLHELIERGSADIDRTELGGNVLELGGFARLVHQHDTKRAIVLRAEFATPGGLERFERDLTSFPLPDLDDDIESAWIELTIRWRTTATYAGPIVDRVVVGVNGYPEPLVILDLGATLREGEPIYARVNLGHPVIVGTADGEVPEHISDTTMAWDSISLPDVVIQREHEAEGAGLGSGGGAGSGLRDGSGFGVRFSLSVFAVKRSRLSALPDPGEPLTIVSLDGDNSPGVVAARDEVRTFLEMVILGTTAQLAASLRESIYIGPLRAIPPRGFLYERAGRIANWADGLAAWDLLLADRLTLVERTNTWLRRLGAGCQVVVQQLFEGKADAEELASGHVDKTVRRLLLDTGAGSFVLPSEVGAGISQLIPVVVAAIEGLGGLTLVEQPEIHVHPAVQVRLGDLLIESVHREGARRTLLIETHSEHLILRVLRRIRQTTENELVDDAPAFAGDKLCVLYVEANVGGVRVRRLRVDERGEFVDRWPKGFFAERMEELL